MVSLRSFHSTAVCIQSTNASQTNRKPSVQLSFAIAVPLTNTISTPISVIFTVPVAVPISIHLLQPTSAPCLWPDPSHVQSPDTHPLEERALLTTPPPIEAPNAFGAILESLYPHLRSTNAAPQQPSPLPAQSQHWPRSRSPSPAKPNSPTASEIVSETESVDGIQEQVRALEEELVARDVLPGERKKRVLAERSRLRTERLERLRWDGGGVVEENADVRDADENQTEMQGRNIKGDILDEEDRKERHARKKEWMDDKEDERRKESAEKARAESRMIDELMAQSEQAERKEDDDADTKVDEETQEESVDAAAVSGSSTTNKSKGK